MKRNHMYPISFVDFFSEIQPKQKITKKTIFYT